jgi:hypothetical protein
LNKKSIESQVFATSPRSFGLVRRPEPLRNKKHPENKSNKNRKESKHQAAAKDNRVVRPRGVGREIEEPDPDDPGQDPEDIGNERVGLCEEK